MGTGDKTYIAVSNEQHPLTGEGIPVMKKIFSSTTIGEVLDWYKTLQHGKGKVYDLRICEPE